MHLEEPTLEEGRIVTRPHTGTRRRNSLIAGGALLLLALLAAGIIPRLTRSAAANDVAHAAANPVPSVSTVSSQAAPPTALLDLPGNVEAVYVSSIYARSNGYVKRRLVDIGVNVKAGQLLAEIESPEIDQELAQTVATLGQSKAAYEQARANVAQAEAAVSQSRAMVDQAVANQGLAQATDRRWTRLVGRGVLSKQAGDEKRSDFNAREAEVSAAQAGLQTSQATVTAQQANLVAAKANIAAAEANVSRLRQMVAYEKVTAPFDGVITERRIERGDLINAGNGSPQAKLFSIAQGNLLRIQVHVPQAYAVDIKDGQLATIDVRERAGHPVTGRVVRSANALNADSRTLLAEVQVDNSKGLLLPGMYADVKFTLASGHNVVLIPADTLITDGQGTRVATVAGDGKLHFQTVEVGRDLGPQIEILNGLNGREQLVANPSDSLTEGQTVQPLAQKS